MSFSSSSLRGSSNMTPLSNRKSIAKLDMIPPCNFREKDVTNKQKHDLQKKLKQKYHQSSKSPFNGVQHSRAQFRPYTVEKNTEKHDASSQSSTSSSVSNYRDYSCVPAKDPRYVSALFASSEKEVPFPIKLHKILSDKSFRDIVTWLPHGRSWRVLDPKAFENKVLPLHFRHCRYASFMRQVNGWGFHRVSEGQDHSSYYHELFLRGLPHLCLEMIRSKHKSPSKAVLAPNFYHISDTSPLPEEFELENESIQEKKTEHEMKPDSVNLMSLRSRSEPFLQSSVSHTEETTTGYNDVDTTHDVCSSAMNYSFGTSNSYSSSLQRRTHSDSDLADADYVDRDVAFRSFLDKTQGGRDVGSAATLSDGRPSVMSDLDLHRTYLGQLKYLKQLEHLDRLNTQMELQQEMQRLSWKNNTQTGPRHQLSSLSFSNDLTTTGGIPMLNRESEVNSLRHALVASKLENELLTSSFIASMTTSEMQQQEKSRDPPSLF